MAILSIGGCDDRKNRGNTLSTIAFSSDICNLYFHRVYVIHDARARMYRRPYAARNIDMNIPYLIWIASIYALGFAVFLFIIEILKALL